MLKAALGAKGAKAAKESKNAQEPKALDSEKSESRSKKSKSKADKTNEPGVEKNVEKGVEKGAEKSIEKGAPKDSKELESLHNEPKDLKTRLKSEPSQDELKAEAQAKNQAELSTDGETTGKKPKGKKIKEAQKSADSQNLKESKESPKAKASKDEAKSEGKSLAGAALGGASGAALATAGGVNAPNTLDSKEASLAQALHDEGLELAESPLEELGSLGKGAKANTQNLAKSSSLAQSIAALESGTIKESKSGKDSKDDRRGKNAKAESKESKSEASSKSEGAKALEPNALTPQELESLEGEEKTSFAEMFLANAGKKKGKAKEIESEEALKESKGVSKQTSESVSAKEAQRTQILHRSAMAKESVRNFAQALREEVLNYKPPVTKLSFELNPHNLGTLELTITKKGKDLHVQVISNSAAIGLFMQNQSDFRANLAQIGFENVDLSFSANDGGGGKNQGSQGEGGGQNQGFSESSEPEGNKNGLEDSQMATRMDIILPKYV